MVDTIYKSYIGKNRIPFYYDTIIYNNNGNFELLGAKEESRFRGIKFKSSLSLLYIVNGNFNTP